MRLGLRWCWFCWGITLACCRRNCIWLAVKTVLLVLVIVLLVWRIVAGRNRRVRQEQPTPRVYTWQYKLYRVLSILSAILYLVGGLITIVSGFLFLNAAGDLAVCGGTGAGRVLSGAVCLGRNH